MHKKRDEMAISVTSSYFGIIKEKIKKLHKSPIHFEINISTSFQWIYYSLTVFRFSKCQWELNLKETLHNKLW